MLGLNVISKHDLLAGAMMGCGMFTQAALEAIWFDLFGTGACPPPVSADDVTRTLQGSAFSCPGQKAERWAPLRRWPAHETRPPILGAFLRPSSRAQSLTAVWWAKHWAEQASTQKETAPSWGAALDCRRRSRSLRLHR